VTPCERFATAAETAASAIEEMVEAYDQMRGSTSKAQALAKKELARLRERLIEISVSRPPGA
jgi:hypothetical protein